LPKDIPATVPVLLPLALPAAYDYLAPDGIDLAPGTFVIVPLGPVLRLGVVWPRDEAAKPVPREKLKAVAEILDGVPPLPRISIDFAKWVANYTLTPVGMVLRMMMSASAAFDPPAPKLGVRLLHNIVQRMTPARSRVLALAENGMIWPKSELAQEAGVSPGVIDGLVTQGALQLEALPERAETLDPDHPHAALTPDQQRAASALRESMRGGFTVGLLDGVTGSGKTLVYFEAIAEALQRGKQALVLMPEIALTSQFLARCEERFGAKPAEWHSGLTSATRGRVWRAVAQRKAKLVVGARSALFLPFPDLGLIVVDEEHDQSYKQEERVTYQARDMAVVRAHLGNIPVVLSSATPSIETLVNARQGRYRHITLATRFEGAGLPDIAALDMRKGPPERGRWLSPALVEAVGETLARGEQALLFLNRRGYAPVTLCRSCGFRFECPDCSAWLVEHRLRRRLECHHCGTFIPVPEACPKCNAEHSLVACGPGIERIEEEVAELFPQARRALLSSDVVPNLTALREVLRRIEEREADIVIGTQLVAKGHHFPGLALVGVVDADLSLGQADPRAAERTFQLLNQVTGRAGRAAVKGRGLIQTYMPEHPVMQALIAADRDTLLAREIEERRKALMPPFGRLASLLVTARTREAAEGYARAIARAAPPAEKIAILGPAEAPLAVIRGRHRYRLLVKAAREADLQAYLRLWLSGAPKPKGDTSLQIDIDPYSFL
jgi:primosomal protein N' (replication factor Y) (superfamily II helicase)